MQTAALSQVSSSETFFFTTESDEGRASKAPHAKKIPPSKGWVGGYIKRVPPSPLLAPKSPEPKGFGRLNNVHDSQEESVM